jgi:hypothetical protein
MPHTLFDEFSRCFGAALPAGFLCRRVLLDRWVRIHSLPRSKRYAETETERVELLHRHNVAATYVLGEGAECIAFITRFGEVTDRSLSEVSVAGTPAEHVLSVRYDDEDLHFFALRAVWRENCLDDLLAAVAEDRTGPVLFANTQRRCIYAPYDGGADLFFPSTDTAALARNRLHSWLSDREDGL